MAAAMLVGPFAQAGQAPAESPASTKLKWRARGTTPARTLEHTAPARVAAPEVQQAYRATPADKFSNTSSRARMRDRVMQVSSQDPLDSLLENSAQPSEAQPTDEQPGVTEQPPVANELIPPAADDEPPMLRPEHDPYPDEPIPSRNLGTEPPPPLPVPSGDLGVGISTPGTLSCDDYKKDCMRAVRDLQGRDITKIVAAVVIEGVEGTDYPCDCKLGREVDAPRFAGRHFAPTLFTWKAAGTCHKPLYFEDVHLERYGHSWNPVVQPFMSAAHFFVSVPLLPYKMGLNTPNECVYTLGYYRPGSCAPYMIDPIPWSLRGAVFQGLGATAFAFWFWPPG